MSTNAVTIHPWPSGKMCSDIGKAILNQDGEKALGLLKVHPFSFCEAKTNMLAMAIQNCRHSKLSRELIARADINAISYLGRYNNSALHAAAKILDADIVCLLLEKRVDPNLSDSWGRTPLSCAVFAGPGVVKLCAQDDSIRYGLNPLAPSEIGNRLLRVAKIFIEYGASVDQADAFGESPLERHLSVADADIEPRLIAFLIKEGAAPKKGKCKKQPEVHTLITRATIRGLAARTRRKEEVVRVLEPTLGQVAQAVVDYV